MGVCQYWRFANHPHQSRRTPWPPPCGRHGLVANQRSLVTGGQVRDAPLSPSRDSQRGRKCANISRLNSMSQGFESSARCPHDRQPREILRPTLASNGAGCAQRHGEPPGAWILCLTPILLLGGGRGEDGPNKELTGATILRHGLPSSFPDDFRLKPLLCGTLLDLGVFIGISSSALCCPRTTSLRAWPRPGVFIPGSSQPHRLRYSTPAAAFSEFEGKKW